MLFPNQRLKPFDAGNERFFVRSRKMSGDAEVYIWYSAQGITKSDVDMAEKIRYPVLKGGAPAAPIAAGA